MPIAKPGSEHVDIDQTLAVLRRRWWVIALVTLITAGATLALAKHQTKLYTATASVLFRDSQLTQQASGLQVTPNSPSSDSIVMGTDVQLLSNAPGIAAATARRVGHGLKAADVTAAVTVSQQGQTNIANVSATHANPSVAAQIANTYVSLFVASQQAQAQAQVTQALRLVERQVSALSAQQLAGTNGQALLDRAESLRVLATMQTGGAQIQSHADVPASPSSPKVARDVVLGVLVGLLLGLALSFLLERLDRRMKDLEDLESTYQLPVLAAVPNSKHYATAPNLDESARDGHHEVFHLLRAYLRYFNVDREIRVLAVASGAPGEGKSTVARNLAQAAQETGSHTLLIEADLRRAGLARLYGLKPSPGLSELLVGTAEAVAAIRSVPVATRVNGSSSRVSLDVLVAGHPPPNPGELLASRAMEDLLGWAREQYQLVVIDTPPLAVVADAMPLLHGSDGVIVVTQLDKHTRDSAALLRKRLVAVNVPLLGVVANGIKSRTANGYGYGYGRRYPSDPDERNQQTLDPPAVDGEELTAVGSPPPRDDKAVTDGQEDPDGHEHVETWKGTVVAPDAVIRDGTPSS